MIYVYPLLMNHIVDIMPPGIHLMEGLIVGLTLSQFLPNS